LRLDLRNKLSWWWRSGINVTIFCDFRLKLASFKKETNAGIQFGHKLSVFEQVFLTWSLSPGYETWCPDHKY
jgi:hypothetical protein